MQYVPPLNGNLADADRPWEDADPGTGAGGSRIAAKGIENTMREVVNAITALGTVPDGAVLTQLGAAIIAYVAAQVAAVTTNFASDAETLALTVADKAVAPANLDALIASTTQKGLTRFLDSAGFATGTDNTMALTAALFNVVAGTPGRVYLPHGLLVQWGLQASVTNSTDGSGANSTITLPVSFTTGIFYAGFTLSGSTGGQVTNNGYIPVSNSAFKLAASQSGSRDYFWLVIGK